VKCPTLYTVVDVALDASGVCTITARKVRSRQKGPEQSIRFFCETTAQARAALEQHREQDLVDMADSAYRRWLDPCKRFFNRLLESTNRDA